MDGINISRRRTAPRALTNDQQRRLLQAAERRGARDHALVSLALDTGLREAELAALDDADAFITARTGKIRVLGKGDRYRELPLPARTRALMTIWRQARSKLPGRVDLQALFLARGGRRFSTRSIELSHVLPDSRPAYFEDLPDVSALFEARNRVAHGLWDHDERGRMIAWRPLPRRRRRQGEEPIERARGDLADLAELSGQLEDARNDAAALYRELWPESWGPPLVPNDTKGDPTVAPGRRRHA